ncbi:cytochrome c1 [Acetobacter sp. AN02]|uniref:cytochrome c1 n=1 Tax=Acetobacter sp. AN02 TaxID=2894186 RepID=UPI0024341E29|nr:cytochrome c1 [Acetobacter sp. AN02]MDG6095504.1 cytochrome c1 [Acetobacter sp. AN02]
MRRSAPALTAGLLAAALVMSAPVLSAASAADPGHDAAPAQSWSFLGLTGQYDKAAVRRGYQVYEQVCSTCHGMKYLRFGDLLGAGLTADQVRAVAASHQVPGGTDPDGKPVMRSATSDDPFPPALMPPGPVVPPDQSRLAAVYSGGPDRIFALLTGYGDPPHGVTPPPGLFYNRFAAGRAIAMPPPLQDGSVTYADGTKATLVQEARDVTTFLAWASDPHLGERHRTGVRAVLYLCFLIVLLVLLKRRIWNGAHRKVKGETQGP